MKKVWSASLALAVTFAIVPAALADNFSYTFTSQDGSFDATGTLTGTATGGGVFDITGGTILLTNLDATDNLPDTGTGSLTGGTGSALSDKLPGGFTAYYDNELTPGSSPFVDGSGLLFLSGTTLVQIFSDSPFAGAGTYDYYLGESDGGFIDNGELTVSANTSATPEPSSLLLFGTGLLGLTGVMYRRARV